MLLVDGTSSSFLIIITSSTAVYFGKVRLESKNHERHPLMLGDGDHTSFDIGFDSREQDHNDSQVLLPFIPGTPRVTRMNHFTLLQREVKLYHTSQKNLSEA